MPIGVSCRDAHNTYLSPSPSVLPSLSLSPLGPSQQRATPCTHGPNSALGPTSLMLASEETHPWIVCVGNCCVHVSCVCHVMCAAVVCAAWLHLWCGPSQHTTALHTRPRQQGPRQTSPKKARQCGAARHTRTTPTSRISNARATPCPDPKPKSANLLFQVRVGGGRESSAPLGLTHLCPNPNVSLPSLSLTCVAKRMKAHAMPERDPPVNERYRVCVRNGTNDVGSTLVMGRAYII